MLVKLAIQNYALIDHLEINFSEKLNVITGETGAGKSIIMGALGLILGQRADSTVLVDKGKKCIVEGYFRLNSKQALDFLESNDLDVMDELVVRREIGTNGKSRAFLNDTPVGLQQLQSFSTLLVDLHQQMDALELGDSDFQLEVMDALSNQMALVNDYQRIFRQLQELRKSLAVLIEKKQAFDKEADYDRFQLNELEEAHFKENELEDIDAELKMMNHAEGIRTALDKVNDALLENEHPIVQELKILQQQLQQYSTYHASIPELIGRLQSSQIELRDIAGEVSSIYQQVNVNPDKIEQYNERLSVGYRLLKKHGVKTTQELLAIQNGLKEKLTVVENMDEAIQAQQKEEANLLSKVMREAEKLSKGRNLQKKPLEEKVNKLLQQVGMPHARLKADMQKQEPNRYGIDKVEFLFNANVPAGTVSKEQNFYPVRKVASGGELSRLMLCIKSLVAESIDLPTMIFDEIDTGISGEAARQVSIILKGLAANRQIICITHQPQIAGKADAHYFVYKSIVNDLVKTNIKELQTDERISIIAKMLSGEKPTAAAMENAREMLIN